MRTFHLFGPRALSRSFSLPMMAGLGLGLVALAPACSDDTTSASASTQPESGDGDGDLGTGSETGDGDGDTSGDGDGDPSGDGDGDSSGDGDGDELPPCSLAWEVTQMKVNGHIHAGNDVAVGPDGSFVAVGRVDLDDDFELWIGKFDESGQALWEQVLDSNGSDSASGVEVDAAGDVYVTGSYGAGDSANVWLSKRSGADGSELWSITKDNNFDGDNLPGDLALGAEGELFMSATIRRGDDDTDISVFELSTQDGSDLWSASFSGQPDPNGFSIDRAGALSVAAGGEVYVGGIEGVDFETREGVLLAFDSNGASEAEPLWRFAPQVDGETHEHAVSAVLAGPDDEAYAVIRQNSGDWRFWVYRVSAGGQVEWELSEQDFIFGPTNDWFVNGLELRANGQLSISGNLRATEVGEGIDWSEVWIANLTRDGVGQCIEAHTWQNTNIIPASTFGFGFAEGPNGTVAVGEIRNGPENYLWMGGYK